MQDEAPLCTSKTAQNWCWKNLLYFWVRDVWPGNKPEVNSNESLWVLLQERANELQTIPGIGTAAPEGIDSDLTGCVLHWLPACQGVSPVPTTYTTIFANPLLSASLKTFRFIQIHKAQRGQNSNEDKHSDIYDTPCLLYTQLYHFAMYQKAHIVRNFFQTVMGKCSVPTKRPSPKRRRRTGPATYRAVRADEAAHVLDDTEQFEAGAATEGHLAADVPHGQVLRSGDQHTAVTAERPAGERRVTATADSSTQPSQRKDLQERDVSQLRQTAAHSRHNGETCRREACHSYSRQQHTAVTAERPAGERRVTATADSSTQPSQRRDLQERDVSQLQQAAAHSRHSGETCRRETCHSYSRQQHTAVTAERPAGERRVTATADSSTQPSQRRDLQERDVSQLQQTAAHSRHSGETCRRETCHSYSRQQHTAVTAERPAGERRVTATAGSSTQPSQRRDLRTGVYHRKATQAQSTRLTAFIDHRQSDRRGSHTQHHTT